jgi:D-aspartate ligase
MRAPSFLRSHPRSLAGVREHVAGRALPAAVVCDVGWVNGLGALRALGRAGVPVIAVDHRLSALGFRSRYAFPVVAPDPVPDEAGFVDFMRELGETLDRPAPVFPTQDQHLNALARHREDLGERFLYPFPGWDGLEPLQSKRHQLETAAALGLGVPRTRHPRSADEARTAGSEVGFPLLVKPSDNILFKRVHGRQAFLCRTPDEVERAYEATATFEPMVQEFIPGGDDHLWTLGAYVARDGEALARFSGRKLLQTHANIGAARTGEAVWDEEVVESGLALLGALGFHGIAQVEWKRDARDGSLKLMEVNPRLWQWHSLAAACGADPTMAAYWDLLGHRPAPRSSDGSGKRWSITVMTGRRVALMRPPYVEAVFALDDPKPAVVHAGRYIHGVLASR